MKTVRPRGVLGIDPGTRYVGTAIIEGRELVHHCVFDISESSAQKSLATVRRVVGRLIEAYQPTILAVERTFFARGRHAPRLRLVTEELEALGRELGLDTRSIAPSSVKKAITGNGHADKQDVAKAVCQGFPQLRAFQGGDRKWKARFHFNMFDAIAVAVAVAPAASPGTGPKALRARD